MTNAYFVLLHFRSRGPHHFFTLPLIIAADSEAPAQEIAEELVKRISVSYELVIQPSSVVRYQPHLHQMFVQSILKTAIVPITVVPPLDSALSQPDTSGNGARAGLVAHVARLDDTELAPCYALA